MQSRFLEPEEQARILARAAELQVAHQEAESRSVARVTLEDLEKAALDTGIDPRFVRLAASESSPPVKRKSTSVALIPGVFAVCQIVAWSALVYGEMTLTLAIGIPATLVLAYYATQGRLRMAISTALLLGSTLATVVSTVLQRRIFGESQLLLATEEELYKTFAGQFGLFLGSVVLFYILIRAFRADREIYRSIGRSIGSESL